MHPVFLTGVSFHDGTPHSCGMSVCRGAILHHHIKTPNCSQLGVFIWAIPRARGVRRNSTCANPLRYLGRYCPPNLIFRLLFSRNFCKPSRCGTRRTPFTATTYACVGYEGFAIDLLRQTMRFVCCRTQRFEKTLQKVVIQQHTALRTAPAAFGCSPTFGMRSEEGRLPVFLCHGTSP